MREGWEIKQLKKIGRTQTGTTPPTKDKKNYGNYIPFVKPPHFKPNGEIDSGDSMLSEQGLSNGRFFEANSVLMVCIGATIGKVGYTTIPVSSNQQINVLTPNDGVNYRFIYYGMTTPHFQNRILEEGKSSQATLPIINKSKWENLELPIPPHPEQKRIVEILDEAFEAIDQAKANIEKNIQNAEELFQSKLNKIFSQKGKGWEEKRLDEVCIIRPSKNQIKERTLDDDLVSFVPMSHLKINTKYFEHESTKKLSEVYKGYTYFEDGDVLLAKITPCFENGKLGIAMGLENGIGFGSSEYIVYRPQSGLSNEFLYYFLNRDSFRKIGEAMMGGAVGHQRIQKEFYEDFNIAFPGIMEQAEIIKELDALGNFRSNLISSYSEKLDSLEELKKSILQKAFSGELTGVE